MSVFIQVLHIVLILSNVIIATIISNTPVGSCHPEGFVIRTAEGFSQDAFDRHVAKYVREGHVQTDETWRRTWKQAKLYQT